MTEDGQHPEKERMKFVLKDQLTVSLWSHNLYITLVHDNTQIYNFITPSRRHEKKLGSSLSRKVQFFSFSQDRDSVLNSDEGRQKLKDVGIGSPQDVGEWLVEVFQRDFGQETLASQLESFIHCPSHFLYIP